MMIDLGKGSEEPTEGLPSPRKKELPKELRELIPAGIAVAIGFLVVLPPFLFPKFAVLSAFLVAPAISLFGFVRACQLAGKRGNYVPFDYLEALGAFRFFIAIGFFGLYVFGYLALWFIVQVRCVWEKPRKFLPWMGLQAYGPVVGFAAIVMAFVGDSLGPNRTPPVRFQAQAAHADGRHSSSPNAPAPAAPDPAVIPPDKDPGAKPPPEKKQVAVVTGDAALDELLANLEITVAPQWFAAEKLSRMTPNVHRAAVARALARALKTAPIANRGPIIDALGIWGTPAQVPMLIDFLSDPDIAARGHVLKALGALRDERAVKPVMRCFLESRGSYDAELALIALGPLAEREVAELLKHQEPLTRRNACQILGKIGTAASVPALEAARKEAATRGPAERALREIAARSGK
jgi:HEAT repeat protein